MESADLSAIESMFKEEYSLRYRMVQLMFEACQEACFVYEQQGEILGVTFNKIDDNSQMYMRQIFVREECRGTGIGRTLYEKRLDFARQLNIRLARANIRNETWAFHEEFCPEKGRDVEYYVVREV